MLMQQMDMFHIYTPVIHPPQPPLQLHKMLPLPYRYRMPIAVLRSRLQFVCERVDDVVGVGVGAIEGVERVECSGEVEVEGG